MLLTVGNATSAADQQPMAPWPTAKSSWSTNVNKPRVTLHAVTSGHFISSKCLGVSMTTITYPEISTPVTDWQRPVQVSDRCRDRAGGALILKMGSICVICGYVGVIQHLWFLAKCMALH